VRGSRLRVALIVLGLAALAAGLLWIKSQGPDAPAHGDTARPAAAAPVDPGVSEVKDRETGDGHAIVSGGTLELVAVELAGSEPVLLDLLLPAPPESVTDLPVRVLAPDGRVLELQGLIAAEDRGRARVVLDPAWLSPGRYIVEIQTMERTHFPLRRYALEVR
jgi:hypothetical protein